MAEKLENYDFPQTNQYKAEKYLDGNIWKLTDEDAREVGAGSLHALKTLLLNKIVYEQRISNLRMHYDPSGKYLVVQAVLRW